MGVNGERVTGCLLLGKLTPSTVALTQGPRPPNMIAAQLGGCGSVVEIKMMRSSEIGHRGQDAIPLRDGDAKRSSISFVSRRSEYRQGMYVMKRKAVAARDGICKLREGAVVK